jgi:hypothetical protein
MYLTLNAYQRYIDLQTMNGLQLYISVFHRFKIPLTKRTKINLTPQDFQKLAEQMNRLGSQYGCNHMFKQIPLTHTVVPAIPAIPRIASIAAITADSLAVPQVLALLSVPAIPAVPAVLEQIIFGNFHNMIEIYLADNIKMALLNASTTWGNDSSTSQTPQVICEMTIAKNFSNDANKP